MGCGTRRGGTEGIWYGGWVLKSSKGGHCSGGVAGDEDDSRRRSMMVGNEIVVCTPLVDDLRMNSSATCSLRLTRITPIFLRAVLRAMRDRP